MAWTEDQLKAIYEKDKNIIVSAGAGSGKTAVLTERVKTHLLNGVSLKNLLVLTFTNAAAKEMLERIKKTIIENPSISKELDYIDNSYITTFDAYALSLVKKYHTELNIDKNIAVTDEVYISLIRKKIIDEVFDEYYLSPAKEFNKLIKDFCLKDDKELKDNIDKIYQNLELIYDKNKYIDKYLKEVEELDKSYIFEFKKFLLKKRDELSEMIENSSNYFSSEFVNLLKDNFKYFLNAKNYNELLLGINYNSLRVEKDCGEFEKEYKKSIFTKAKELKEYLIYEKLDDAYEEIRSTYDNQKIIFELIKKIDTKFTNYKQNNKLYTFSDIFSYAIKLVSSYENVKEEIKNSFYEVLIDEYQDTSDLQEVFLSIITENNLYMVGDIKQSIYRFRNANPYIFKNKYDSYSNNTNGMKIDLLKNFRSRSEVLSDINLIFDSLMSDNLGGADYKKSHQMVYGNTNYEINKPNQDYNLEVLEYSDTKNNYEKEAFIIAKDIKEKINSNYQILDKNTNNYRNINYNDIVILLDKSKYFDMYKKIFEYLHIPLTILKDEKLSDDKDILVIKSLIKLIISIKNNNLDKFSYVSVARSFLFKLDDDLIYDIVVNDKYKETTLYKKCFDLTTYLDILPMGEMLKLIFNSFNYEELLITIGNINVYRTRLEYIYNLAVDFSSNNNTIYDFINYLDELEDIGAMLSFNLIDEYKDSVKIMTIHKSKGLEFPICYFSAFSSKFNLSDLNDKIIFDRKYGLVLPYVNNYYKDTIKKLLLKDYIRCEEISERIRLFYVALTRAKEKMIMVLSHPKNSKSLISFNSFVGKVYDYIDKYVKNVDVEVDNNYLLELKKDMKLEKYNDNLEINEISINTNLIKNSKFSKSSINLITKEEKSNMEFGTKIHEVLELIDFKNPKLEIFDINNKIKEKIKLFLSSDIISSNINNKMYKEYEFIDISLGIKKHGIIDLLIDAEDKFIIIDYKLNNIIDSLYNKQLNGYKEYIEKTYNKKCICYLYSILQNEFIIV